MKFVIRDQGLIHFTLIFLRAMSNLFWQGNGASVASVLET